jgi:DHA3 family macrolide efflux protein-like MFS transporter
MFVGAIAIAQFGATKNKLSIIVYSLLFTGIVSFFSGILPPTTLGFWLFAILCLLTGAGVNAHHIAHTVYIQETVPKEAQGRVFSLVGSILSISTPVGLIIAGPVSERYGVSAWFVISGVAVAMIFLLYLLITRTSHRRELR